MIKTRLKSLAIESLAFSELPALLQKVLGKKSIAIFTYHAVLDDPLAFPDWCFLDSATFRKQMTYLKAHFNVISLSEACDQIRDKTIGSHAAVITFDDGYANNHDIALPILQELNLPATIYLNTTFTDSDDSIWFTQVHQALTETTRDSVSWSGGNYNLASASAKEMCSRMVQQYLKRQHPNEIYPLIAKFRSALGLPCGLPELAEPFRMLSSQQVNAMQQTGLIEFGAHTADHTILSRLTKKDQQEQVGHSIGEVERITKRPCRHFAYPNGGKSDFNSDSIEVLKEIQASKTQSTSATTMISKKCNVESDLLQLPRYPVGADTSFARFKLMAHSLL